MTKIEFVKMLAKKVGATLSNEEIDNISFWLNNDKKERYEKYLKECPEDYKFVWFMIITC